MKVLLNRVCIFGITWTIDSQGPLSMEFSRQECCYCKVTSVVSDSVRPHTGQPSRLGSSVPGILQARTLEWVAISFSNAWKGKVKVKSLSRAWLLATPWTAAYQAPPSMGFSRQEYWSGVKLPSGMVIHSLHQGIFPAQESNSNLLYCRQIIYYLSHQRSPNQDIEKT